MAYSIRSHQKSRKGCNNCKLRRVKCDEGKPQCSGCLRRAAECVYEPAKRRAKSSARDADPVLTDSSEHHQPTPFAQQMFESTNYSAKNLLDLRLMHHYSVFTADFFAGTFSAGVSAALKIDLPRLALQHEFLMDAILLVAMVHIGCTDSISLECLPVYLYKDQALRALRQAITAPAHRNLDAIRGASHLLAVISFAADRITKQPGLWAGNWLTLSIGQRNVRSSSGNLYGSFADFQGPAIVPTDIQNALSRQETEIDFTQRDCLHRVAMDVGKLISILQFPYEQSWLETKIKAWAFDAIPPKYLDMVRDENPCALVILAFYLAFFRFLPDTWTFHGAADHDMRQINDILGEEWEEYISVPKQVLQSGSTADIAKLLLNSLPN